MTYDLLGFYLLCYIIVDDAWLFILGGEQSTDNSPLFIIVRGTTVDIIGTVAK